MTGNRLVPAIDTEDGRTTDQKGERKMKWIETNGGKDYHQVLSLVNDDGIVVGQVCSKYGDVYGVCDLRQPNYGSPSPYAVAYCHGVERAKRYMEELVQKGSATNL